MQDPAMKLHSVEQPAWQGQASRPGSGRRLRVLLLKPYQPVVAALQSPPLGLLYLTSALRERFQGHIDIRVIDMKVAGMRPSELLPVLQEFQPDVVGMSALNFEANASYRIAEITKQHNPATITVLGGPYALSNVQVILENPHIDWVFEGGAERTFPEVLMRLACGMETGTDIPGLSWQKADGSRHVATGQDQVNELDTLPMPAYDLVDFDLYAGKPNMAANLKGKRYMPLFTSRGCPYLCNYCHDIFSKKYVYHSPDRVISEIALLYEKYGVDEFEFVDDIFNLHKPRLKEIMRRIQERWPGKLKLCFPNGLRADIIDQSVVDALCDAGTYSVCVAIETVTPRLQQLVEKHLDIEKTKRTIEMFGRRNLQVTGFFMLGFPTETPEEIRATLDFAIRSDLTLALFFPAIPQPGTPMYDLAIRENKEATEAFNKLACGYRTPVSWYEFAYGYPLAKELWRANVRFYLTPMRVMKVLRHWRLRALWQSLKAFLQIIVPKWGALATRQPAD